MKRIKVAHVIVGLGQGGAETMLYNLLSNMDSHQFENIVISMTGECFFGGKIKRLGIPVYCLNMMLAVPSLRAILKYYQLIKKNRPDIIQTWMYHANALSMIAKPFLPKQSVIFNICHSLMGIKKEKKLTRCAIRLNALTSKNVAGVIFCSKLSMRQHVFCGFYKRNVIFIPNGFDLVLYKPCSRKYLYVRQQLGLNENTKIIALFARFHPIKNQLGFLEAAKHIKEIYNLDIKFLMAGANIDSKNIQLVAKIRQLQLENEVLLLGPVKMSDYMPAVDVLASTSWGEAFPNILGEAMACGVPCVSTDVGDVKDIISDCGYVVPAGDMKNLAARIVKLLRLSEEERRKLSGQCRLRIEDNYSIANVVNQYEQLYLDVVAQV